MGQFRLSLMLVLVATLVFAACGDDSSGIENGNGNNDNDFQYEEITDDRDGNTYKTVKIGEQVWLAENLKYLPSVSGSGTNSGTDAYYHVYAYEGTDVDEAKATTNYSTYGVLYNWTAAISACPAGWHLPSNDEWTTLIDYVGGVEGAGGKLKATGTTHWDSPNTDATNEVGFSALPGGNLNYEGAFGGINYYGYWWTATDDNEYIAWYLCMQYDSADVINNRSTYKDLVFSVRCVKD